MYEQKLNIVWLGWGILVRLAWLVDAFILNSAENSSCIHADNTLQGLKFNKDLKMARCLVTV